ncbi:MAG: EAL domain-containing protein [Coprobacillus sp.]
MKDRFDQLIVDSHFIFETLANNTNDYIYIWNYQDGSYLVSPNLAKDFSIPIEGNHFEDIWHFFVYNRDLERVFQLIEESVKEKKTSIRMEYQVINSYGDYLWFSDKSTVCYNEETNEPELIIGTMHNLSYDGEVDGITGLLMHSKCKELFEVLQSNTKANYGSLMLLGIDDFTSVNTLNTHAFGDMVLRTTVQDLRTIFSENIKMYRYDGDQLLVVADKMNKQDMLNIFKQIKAYTSISHVIQDKPYRFTMSAGVVSYPEDGITWADLEKAVSITLKRAKDTGKNQCVEFTNEMLEEKIHEQSLGRCLADSVEHDFEGFKVVFQPVCYTQNLKVKGAEILLRFVTPDGELVNPDRFIVLLEQSQLIIPVGMWVLEKAIETCKKWVDYIDDFVMNVNVSYIQLRDVTFCDKLEVLLRKYDLDIKHITLELTESYFITDAANINTSMQRLKELHLQVAMDDFGTGYSSLARLSQFNVDVVKIDRSFVQSLHKREYNHDFIGSVVRLCHNVGMKVCVEGVETKEEQESVCILNADFIQGFYVSRPLDEDIFFSSYILKPSINDKLVVVPNMQLRHEQLIGDKDVLTAMMDATPLGLNFWNHDLEIIACNIEVLNMFDAKDVADFKKNFFDFSPLQQPDGKKSMDKAREVIMRGFDGKKIILFWEHCKRNGEKIPTEVTIVRIPYMDDYIVASYTRDMREQSLMEEKIRKFNARLRALLDASPLCLNLWDNQYRNIMCNKEAVKLFGVKNQQEYLDRFFSLSPEYQPDGRLSGEKAMEYIQEVFKTGYKQFEWMHCDLDGKEIPAEITLIKIEGLDEDGKDLVAGYTRDMRVQVEAEKLQRTTNTRIRAVLDSSPVSCILWSDDLKILDCNQVAISMFQADDKFDVINNFDSFMPLKQPDGENSLIKKGKIFQDLFVKNKEMFEWVYVNKNKEEVPCEVSLIRIPLEKENIIVSYSRDLRELRYTLELNDRLSKMAYYDLLTGVISRARFVERLDNDFKVALPNYRFCLVIFDIDFFKSVNDTYGHPAGDMVLKRVTREVGKAIPKNAILGRLGGDEFIIEIPDIGKDQLEQLLNQIVNNISSMKFHYNGVDFSTSISMGASFKTSADDSYHQLLNRSDQALYKAKEKGRNRSSIL